VITRGLVEGYARETGFQLDSVEKVVRLCGIQERIRLQPMLQWKARNVREHRRRT
jgi:hypothetical protein